MKKSIPSVLTTFSLVCFAPSKRAGSDAGASATTGSNNVYIGAGMQGAVGESDACYSKSIFSQTSASGLPVFINSNNKLGMTTSSMTRKESLTACATTR